MLRSPHRRTEFDDITTLLRDWDEYSYNGLVGRDAGKLARLLAAPVAACFEGRVAEGRFPLVVYSAGWFNRSPDNTVLAEYLASHGFVVAALPQLNPGLWTYNFASDEPSIENQARDLEVAIAEASALPFVDRTRIATLGYSTGGDVALIVAGRNALVRAVVGLDASWSLSGDDNDVTGSPYVTAERVRVPVMALRRPIDGGLREPEERIVLLSGAHLIVAEVTGANHGSFGDDSVHRAFLDEAQRSGVRAHDRAAQAVLSFLNVSLRSESFDGDEFAHRLNSSGIAARYIQPTSVQ